MMKKRILAVLLALCLTAAPALAASEPEIQPIAPWAYDAMSEVAALGMWSDQFYSCILDPVTDEQLAMLTEKTAEHLARLGLPLSTAEGDPDAVVIDTTRGGVMNALYQEAAAYQLEGLDRSKLKFLSGLDVVRGDGAGVAEDRVCTLQEALVMAQRLVLGVYDRMNAGSRGFLWKAVSGENTLYLLGTIHVDRNNVYPFHKQLRDMISTSDDAIFEVDFGDVEDAQTFYAMQFYSDGTGLKDHVSAELYKKAVETGAALPAPYTMDEGTVNSYKPWALANAFTSMSLIDSETSSGGGTPMVLDSYVYSKAANNLVTIGAVESYVYQGSLFDSLTPAYQENYLQDSITGDAASDSAANETDVETITQWVEFWKLRDLDGFRTSYDKDAAQQEPDELLDLLYGERDKGMIAYADGYLKAETPHTGILVVGAGHMMGTTGIVQGLADLGYSVELMPIP